METLTKCCTKCGETKPITEFYAYKLGILGKHSTCKTCSNAYIKQYRKTAAGAAKDAAYRNRRREANKLVRLATPPHNSHAYALQAIAMDTGVPPDKVPVGLVQLKKRHLELTIALDTAMAELRKAYQTEGGGGGLPT